MAASLAFFDDLELDETRGRIAKPVLREIGARLGFLRDVGLPYLTLERRASTLSGGEAQRIRLATQIGSSLVGVLYILDEPTIGLHQRDNERLIGTLTRLRDLGNTLIVVEHDEQTLRTADYLVDLGPGAGVHGGRVVASGTVEEVEANPKSITGQYLSGRLSIEPRAERRKGHGEALVLEGASEHNLKNLTVRFPLGVMTVVTGVSGSGKSSLIADTLYPALSNRIMRTRYPEGAYRSLEGVEHVDKVINIDQGPIGRTPRSNPATYVGLFGPLRQLFARIPEAKAMGFAPGRFSFNVKGGRCERCQGAGTLRIEMHFLPDVYVTCDVCKGRRYNRETLEVRYKGRNIHEVLEMTVDEGLEFFRAVPPLAQRLRTLARGRARLRAPRAVRPHPVRRRSPAGEAGPGAVAPGHREDLLPARRADHRPALRGREAADGGAPGPRRPGQHHGADRAQSRRHPVRGPCHRPRSRGR